MAQSFALDGKAINKECPIGEEAIDGESFADYDGHTIGFCCGGCDKKFLAWSKDKKDAFVKASLAGQEAITKKAPDKKNVVVAPNEPYTLETCPVSGEKLGSMGDPIVLQGNGSEVKLCCKGCIKKFKADTDKYMKVVSKGIAAQQLPYYPMDTCLVSGESLTEDGKDVAVDVVIGNRLFRVCCKSCIKKLKKDPGKYLVKLDAAVIKAQASHYPLKTCIVRTKSKLGSMGDPVQRVVGNRLVQFCCKGCTPKFDKNPAKYIASLDAAWAEHHQMRGNKEKGKAPGHEHGGEGHGEGEGHEGH
jgi:hypothetical protein